MLEHIVGVRRHGRRPAGGGPPWCGLDMSAQGGAELTHRAVGSSEHARLQMEHVPQTRLARVLDDAALTCPDAGDQQVDIDRERIVPRGMDHDRRESGQIPRTGEMSGSLASRPLRYGSTHSATTLRVISGSRPATRVRAISAARSSQGQIFPSTRGTSMSRARSEATSARVRPPPAESPTTMMEPGPRKATDWYFIAMDVATFQTA